MGSGFLENDDPGESSSPQPSPVEVEGVRGDRGWVPRIEYGAGSDCSGTRIREPPLRRSAEDGRDPARPPHWIPAPYRGTGQAFGRYDGWVEGEEGEGMGSRFRGNDDWGQASRRYDGWVEGEEGEGKGERRRGFVSGGALLFVDGFPFRREWRFNSAAAAPNRPPRSMFVCPVCLLAAGC